MDRYDQFERLRRYDLSLRDGREYLRQRELANRDEITDAVVRWLEVRDDGFEVYHDEQPPKDVFAKPLYVMPDGREIAITHDVVSARYDGPEAKPPRGRGWRYYHRDVDHKSRWVRTPGVDGAPSASPQAPGDQRPPR